jgi:hypothetical protein
MVSAHLLLNAQKLGGSLPPGKVKASAPGLNEAWDNPIYRKNLRHSFPKEHPR